MAVERLRGRAGVAQRRRRLQLEPVCRHCAAEGRTRASREVDHIIPLSQGGDDTDDNVQCLCVECHAVKTAAEGATTAGASNHPDWLKPSAVPLTIVCGPPCAGKTTYARDHAAPADTIIDLDAIAARLSPSYRQWQAGQSSETINGAIRARNAMLGALSRQDSGAAWFIVSAPTARERAWWKAQLGGEIVLLDPGLEECRRRAIARGTPRAAQGAVDWHTASRGHWEPKRPNKAALKGCDVNGWPVSPLHPWNAK